ncbi:MAG: 50S ribosomal protein L6 [Chlamydiae bacterium]|nr:50S ribosomal protein L6 [Chlamydiota bacterium]
MSRKAKIPIPFPKEVEAKVEGLVVTIKGPKGQLSQDVREGIEVSIKEGEIAVSLASTHSGEKNFLGLYWSLIFNMVKGVQEGYQKKLEMIGVGYRAAVQGNTLDIQAGFSHPTKMSIPEGIEVSIEKNTLITIKGIHKQRVGQFAADIRAKRPPEPYKGKGIRYADEYVRRKAGKAGKK